MSNEYKDQRTQFNDKTKEFDLLPIGWVKTFVPKMKDDLFKALGPYVEDFILLDSKEKWGVLRVSWTFEHRNCNDVIEVIKTIEDILLYYKNVSENTCAICGKSPTLFSNKLNLYICDECNKKYGIGDDDLSEQIST